MFSSQFNISKIYFFGIVSFYIVKIVHTVETREGNIDTTLLRE